MGASPSDTLVRLLDGRHSRRYVLVGGGAGLGALLVAPGRRGRAATQEATPELVTDRAPGVAIGRVRKLPSAELNEAIYPDVMARFLPATAAIPGFLGYVFAFHTTDPTASVTLTLLTDDPAADAAEAAGQQYVGQLDPRFVVATPVAVRGPVRIYATTSAPPAARPPFLHGCVITMRNRTNAPGADMDDVVAKASSGLAPLLAAMPGFVLYCWIQTEGGRTAINIWQTDEQLRAGNDAVEAWVAANTANTTVGEPVVSDGRIGYGVVPGVG